MHLTQKELLASEIFAHLSLYPKVELTKAQLTAELLKMSDDAILFIYQGLAEIEDLHNRRFFSL